MSPVAMQLTETDFTKPLKRGPIEDLIEARPFTRDTAGFCRAMRAAFAAQLRGSAFLRRYLALHDFSPVSIRGERDIARIPFIFVAALKERDLAFLPGSRLLLELTSSGTTGQKSRMQLDAGSLARVRRMAWKVVEGLGMTDLSREYDYICLTYDPAAARDLGTAWTDRLISGFTGRGKVFYSFRWSRERGEFYFDSDGAVEALAEAERAGRPVRLLGFPAFALKLSEDFRKRFGRWAKLNPLSGAITGGGWKTLSDEAMDKGECRRRLAGRLGIPEENIRDMFGMVEHGVPYMDCPLGNFHVPNYGRVIARDPGTLQPLGHGREGLLQFITPYLTSYPSLSLLSSDMGRVEKGCGCGLGGEVLVVKGRAGVRKLKGCAVSAATML